MRFSVGAKIAVGYGIAALLLATIGFASYQSTRKLVDAADLRERTYLVLNHLEGLISDMKDAETGQRGFLITAREDYLEPYNVSQGKSQERLSALDDLVGGSPQQMDRLSAVRPLIATKFSELAETIALRRKPGDDGFKAAQEVVLSDRGKLTMDAIRAKVSEMEKDENDQLAQRQAEAASLADVSKSTIAYGVPLALLILVIASWAIIRSIAPPLVEMTQTAGRIAAGDLTVALPNVSRSDEVGELGRSFGRMIESLRGMASVATHIAEGDLRVTIKPQSEKDVLGTAFAAMIGNLQRLTGDLTEGVNVLGAAAKQIAASSTQLASSATETATAIAETTTTAEEVRQTAQVANQKAKYVADTAQNAATACQAGRKSTEQTGEGMARIREQINSVGQSMVRLSEQSQAIAQIISTVDDLAQQSNLLAVNAAIEAAKAGEQGKGFAVVAQEVRSLAEQSKQATAQVRSILNEVQKATSGAVMATEQGAKVVERGVSQSAEAGESILQLSSSVAETAQAANQIAASSQQQLAGMDQVATAIDTIKQASTQNVESARQLEGSAQNLSDLGQKLRDLIGRFKLAGRAA